MPVDRLAGGDPDRIVGPNPRDGHVQPARGQQGVALKDADSVPGLLDADLARAVETLGERPREPGRHVLHDRDPRGVGRQGGEHVIQRSVPPVDSPIQTTLCVVCSSGPDLTTGADAGAAPTAAASAAWPGPRS